MDGSRDCVYVLRPALSHLFPAPRVLFFMLLVSSVLRTMPHSYGGVSREQRRKADRTAKRAWLGDEVDADAISLPATPVGHVIHWPKLPRQCRSEAEGQCPEDGRLPPTPDITPRLEVIMCRSEGSQQQYKRCRLLAESFGRGRDAADAGGSPVPPSPQADPAIPSHASPHRIGPSHI